MQTNVTSDSNCTRLEVVNNDNVNRICGWGLWKLKRKYKKLIDKGCVDFIFEAVSDVR